MFSAFENKLVEVQGLAFLLSKRELCKVCSVDFPTRITVDSGQTRASHCKHLKYGSVITFLAEVSGETLFALAGVVDEAACDAASVSAADFRREQTRRSRAQFREFRFACIDH